MGKRKSLGQYGFTTTETDAFLTRVGKEAKSTDEFLLVSTKTPEVKTLTLMVRKPALPVKSAGLSILGKPATKA